MNELEPFELTPIEKFNYLIETELDCPGCVTRPKVNPNYADEFKDYFLHECLYPFYRSFMEAFSESNFEQYSKEERKNILLQVRDFSSWVKREEDESKHTITMLRHNEDGVLEPVQAMFEYWKEGGGFMLSEFYIGGRGTIGSLAMVSFCQTKGIALVDLMYGN